MPTATVKRVKKPIRKLHALIARLEGMQWSVEGREDNYEINSAKDALMRLLRKWEAGK